MQIELRSIEQITPYPGNPRKNDPAVAAVAASIREFGFRQPIVVDEQGVILVGHTRFKAALQLGLIHVPVHVAAGLSPPQARAYRLADNRTAAIATWDEDALITELLALQGDEFDLSLTGFPAGDLDRLLAPSPTGLSDPDEVPDPPVEPVTRPGDLYHLGRHRLFCGDATLSVDLDRLTGGRPVDLLLTDPPYNVAYRGKTAEALTIANDAMSDPAYGDFLHAFLAVAVAALRPGGSFYVWHADSHGRTVRDACARAGLSVRQCLVWVKSAFALGRQDYHWRHEPCLYGWKDGAAHTWLGGRTQSTVLEFEKPGRNADHPTMKPVALFATLLANSCPTGGRVLDPFGGSGTTMVAAERTGRTALLLELDPRYCDAIVRRYEGVTGRKADPPERV